MRLLNFIIYSLALILICGVCAFLSSFILSLFFEDNLYKILFIVVTIGSSIVMIYIFDKYYKKYKTNEERS
jgi:uncharacterized membrane protein YfcA